LRFGLNVPENSTQYDNSVHAGAWFLNRSALASAAGVRQIIDNFVNQETQQHKHRFVTVRLHQPQDAQLTQFVVSRADAIAWRLHCIVQVCRRVWSSTAIAVTNRWFI
jgi:hypothetical protein